MEDSDMDFDLNDDGYRSPIDLFVCSYEGELNNIAKQISEQTDNAITAEIVQRFEIDVNKEELLRALAYDRDQYHKGYMAGYQRGQFFINYNNRKRDGYHTKSQVKHLPR